MMLELYPFSWRSYFTRSLCITTYTVLFTLALANLPETSGMVVVVALSLVVVAQ